MYVYSYIYSYTICVCFYNSQIYSDSSTNCYTGNLDDIDDTEFQVGEDDIFKGPELNDCEDFVVPNAEVWSTHARM